MKTKQFILLIVAVAFAANVLATETPKMSIIPLEDTKALVTVEYASPKVNEISIVSENGKVVYYKKSKKEMESFKKIFDLSQLESGSYELNLKAGTTTVKRKMEINNGNISVQKERIELDPYFSFDKDKVIVSYLNYAKEDVEVRIFENRKLVFSQEVGNDFAIHRSYNIAKLEHGIYDVLLADKTKEFWFSVSK